MKAAALLLFFLSGPALGATTCADRAVVVNSLEQNWGESRTMIGTVQEGYVIELFVNQETGTWSILYTDQDQKTCIAIEGENYQSRVDAIGSPT